MKDFKMLDEKTYTFVMKFFNEVVKEDIASSIAEYARLNKYGSFVEVVSSDSEKKK